MTDKIKEDQNVQWSWTVITPSGEEYGVKNLDYESAIGSWNSLLESTEDPILKEKMKEIGKSFGVMGAYWKGYQIRTGAIMPTTQGTERHWCPRRSEGGPGRSIAKDGDHWDKFPDGKRTCSYCGSLHPDDMLQLMEEHGLSCIDPSDKRYKWYLSSPVRAVNASLGPIKYYRMHDTPELVSKLSELLEEEKNQT